MTLIIADDLIPQDDRSRTKEGLIRELERLRRENEELKARAFTPISSRTAARYLRLLATVYGPEAWATPMGVHLVAVELLPDYRLTGPSTGAFRLLTQRGYVERRGTLLRITQLGLGDEHQLSSSVLGAAS